jgi:trigger factor
MKTELKDISATQKELLIEIPGDELRDGYNKISQRYAKGASVAGFRKGFAPLDVIRMRYKEEIKSEVLQMIIPEKVSQAIQESGLQPLAEPHLHLDNIESVKVNGSEPIKLSAHIEVMPEIPMPEYKGIELVRRVKPVEDGEVEDLIANRLSQETALIPVEGRAAELGDTVIADLSGTFDDEPDADPIVAEDLEVVLGDEVIEKSFTDNLIGVNEDDEKEFSVSYAADFSSPALAGKTLHYKAKIKSVGRSETPEMNDEWAQSLDEGYESLEDLRKKLRTDLEIYAKSDADARLRNNAIAKMIENNSFEIPNILIENQARNLLNNFAQDLQQRGVDLTKVEESFVQMAMHQMRTQAERDVRGAMLLDRIAEAEKIEVPQDEVEAEIEKMAEMYRVTPEEVTASLEKQGGTGTIANNLRTRKSIEAIVEHAKVTDGPWVDESLAEADAAADSEVADEERPKKEPKKKAPAKKAAKSKAAE